MGVFYGGYGKLLLANLVGAACIIAFACLSMYVLFKVLNSLAIFRVPLEAEAFGLDAAACGVAPPAHGGIGGGAGMGGAALNLSMHGTMLGGAGGGGGGTAKLGM